MRTLHRLCVGINFSSETKALVQTAADLARPYPATVGLTTVVEPVHFYEHVVAPTQSISIADRVERARNRLMEVGRLAALEGLQIDYTVRVGAAHLELIGAARDSHAEVIVIGRRPGWSPERLLLGSTAERVLRTAPVPVLVVKAPLPPTPATIVVPTDFSDISLLAIEEAAALARHWHSRLVLLHVMEPIAQSYLWLGPAPAVLYLAEPEDLEPEWRALLARVDLSGVEWEHRTVRGDAVATIVATAQEVNAALIVAGTHGHSRVVHAILGSVADELVRGADRCVLTVRPGAEQFDLPP